MLRLTLTRFLHRSGYRVLACSDVRSAAETLAEAGAQPALVLLSARVVDAEIMDGLRRLTRLAESTPILGVVDAVGPDTLQAVGEPAFRFLAPPFDLPDVLRAVRSSLLQSGCELPDQALLEI